MGNRAFTDTRPARYHGPKVHPVREDLGSGMVDVVIDAFRVLQLVAEATSLQANWVPVVPEEAPAERVGPGDHRRDGNIYGQPWR